MFFYELHEGDDEVYSNILVVSESEWEPQEFFELVQRIRHDVQDHYEHDTLIEAVASVLERDHGFVVADDHLTAAVNISREDGDNFLADLESDYDDDDDDDDDDDEPSGEFKTVYAEFDPDATSRLN